MSTYMERSQRSEQEHPPGTTLEEARRRYGRPFAHEPGTEFTPNPEPFLTRWMRERVEHDPA